VVCRAGEKVDGTRRQMDILKELLLGWGKTWGKGVAGLILHV
jgi:hypothetical protein